MLRSAQHDRSSFSTLGVLPCLLLALDFRLLTPQLSIKLHKIIRHVIAEDFFCLSQHLPEDRFKQRLAI